MERLGALISKLQEQYQQKADVASLTLTVQMVLAELQQAKAPAAGGSGNISVVLPKTASAQPAADWKNVTEMTPAPEPDLPKAGEVSPKKEENFGWKFDPLKEIPTMAHQNRELFELNESISDTSKSLNDTLRVEKKELGNVLQETPIRDLKKGIGINDRFVFINDLFKGDETMYERSIKTINSFNILPEAEYWIQRELKLKLAWNEENENVLLFDQLVRRRFS